MYSPVKKQVIEQSGMFAGIGLEDASPFPRERFVDFRALTGDSSDDLPGVPGVGPKSAAMLLATAPVERYFGNAAAVRTALGRKNTAVEHAFSDGTAKDIVERNCALMDLRLPAPCWDELDALTIRGTWDRPAFERWLDEERLANVERDALLTRLDEVARAAGRP